jgi:hypothetical protein
MHSIRKFLPCLLFVLSGSVVAQNFPDKPIRAHQGSRRTRATPSEA